MPVTLTYPGVYIQEVPSGVRTISGVATSVAAFVGWAPKGDTDRATLVQSWADYERLFGGLDSRSLLGYALYHFFNNGGSQAYVVRLVSGAGTASVTLTDGTTDVLQVDARNPGEWGKDYGVVIKRRADDATRFRLAVVQVPAGSTQEIVVEAFDNLSMDAGDPRDVVKVIESASSLVRASRVGTPTTTPADTSTPSPRLTATGDLDGTVLQPNTGAFETALEATGSGVNLLDRVDIFNLLCVPGESNATVLSSLQKFCHDRRAFLIADCDQSATFTSLSSGPDSNLTGTNSINAALYFPWLSAPDPLQENRLGEFPPCGFVAGIFARTDASRGIWKAPAGIDASLTGVDALTRNLTNGENGQLNVTGINCLRNLKPYGNVVWGSRTLRGNSEIGSEWQYIPVRRLALFLEESLYRGTQWVVFEPNDEPLWSQIRLNVGSFLQNLYRQGAFQGRSAREAFFVKCDSETTTQGDINRGIVNIHVGFAPLKPAEFVVIQIQQMAGQAQA